MLIRIVTLSLCTAIVVLGFALSASLIVSGYENWIGVLRDPDATGPSRQFTLYSVVARYVIALAISVATTIFAWERWKRHDTRIGPMVIVLALLSAGPEIVTH